jgi:hypothetical protein
LKNGTNSFARPFQSDIQSDIFVTLESCIEMQIQDSEKLLEILLIRVKLLRRWVLLFGEILWLLRDIAVW